MTTNRSMLVAFVIAGLAACTGGIHGEDAEPGADDVTDPEEETPVVDPTTGESVGSKPVFSCGGKEKAPPSLPLRRLTGTQYRNTVEDLLGWTLGDGAAAKSIVASLASTFEKYPAEERKVLDGHSHGTFRQLSQEVQQAHIEVTYEIGMAIGKVLAEKHTNKLTGDCVSRRGQLAPCLDELINSFGARALRRPLEPDEVEFFRKTFYRAGPDTLDKLALSELVAGFLASPQFLYTVEHGSKPVSGLENVFELSSFELASRLSYQLTQTMPDDELWQKASSGALLDPAVLAGQVDRLMQSDRARGATAEFYADFLKLDRTADATKNAEDRSYKAFLRGAKPGAGLRLAMIDDVVDLLQHYTWKVEGSLTDVMTSQLSFARDPTLAGIYGVSPWDGVGDPVALPPGQRPGLLTRAAFVSTDETFTRPIMKGVFVRTSILCDEIPEPPPGAANDKVDLARFSVRKGTEMMTEQSGTSCVTCHAVLINPLGFATENYDALGRHRTEEVHFDAEGKEALRAGVETRTVPRVFLEDKREVSGAGELMQRILESGKMEACLARNLARFTFARLEDSGDGPENKFAGSADACFMEKTRQALGKGGSLRQMFRAAALAPELRRRTIPQ